MGGEFAKMMALPSTKWFVLPDTGQLSRTFGCVFFRCIFRRQMSQLKVSFEADLSIRRSSLRTPWIAPVNGAK